MAPWNLRAGNLEGPGSGLKVISLIVQIEKHSKAASPQEFSPGNLDLILKDFNLALQVEKLSKALEWEEEEEEW